VEFGLSEEQNLLKRSVDGFLDSNSSLDNVRSFVENGGDVWAGLSELGVPAVLIPESAGGLGLSMLDAAIVADSLGAHTAPAPFVSSAVMLPVALKAAGGDHDSLLAQLAVGETTAGVAVADAYGARAGSGITSNDNRLNGNALYVLDFDADVYLVADNRQQLFLVASDADNLSSQHLTTIDRTRSTGELTFSETPATKISDDPAVLRSVLDAGRVMLAADTLGAAQNMLDQAVEYAKQREQFNRPIGSFQAVKHMCAEMAAGLEPCRAMVWFAAHALDNLPDEATLTACHTKAHVSEVGKFIAKTSTEVHGGMGFTDLVGLHYWFKRIGFNRQLLGAPELLREEAARAQQLVA
jgi:alkylation response protein AidB-like acyl-CoA dehydrogenase